VKENVVERGSTIENTGVSESLFVDREEEKMKRATDDVEREDLTQSLLREEASRSDRGRRRARRIEWPMGELIREGDTVVDVLKAISSKWRKMGCEWRLAGLNGVEG
jgi:hypothetical protein